MNVSKIIVYIHIIFYTIMVNGQLFKPTQFMLLMQAMFMPSSLERPVAHCACTEGRPWAQPLLGN